MSPLIRSGREAWAVPDSALVFVFIMELSSHLMPHLASFFIKIFSTFSYFMPAIFTLPANQNAIAAVLERFCALGKLKTVL